MDQGNMNLTNNALVSTMRPVKPEAFDGARDYLKLNTWLHQMGQFFSIVQSTSQTEIMDNSKVMFASLLLNGNAATWWYTLQTSGISPNTWEAFAASVRQEFIPEDHQRRARENSGISINEIRFFPTFQHFATLDLL